MVIQLAIDKTEPLMGTATDERGTPVHFVGWMAMLRAISDLVDAATGSREQAEDHARGGTTDETATITWIGQRDGGRAAPGRADLGPADDAREQA